MGVIAVSDERVDELLKQLGQPPLCCGAKIVFEPCQAVKIIWECYLDSEHVGLLKGVAEDEFKSEVVPAPRFGVHV